MVVAARWPHAWGQVEMSRSQVTSALYRYGSLFPVECGLQSR
jgi:hypothetical protein